MSLSRKHVLRQHLTPLIPSKSAHYGKKKYFWLGAFLQIYSLKWYKRALQPVVSVEILKINKIKINHMIGAQRGPMRAQFPAREF